MLMEFTTYQVYIKEKPFLTEERDEYPRTAIITFLDRNQNEAGKIERAYLDAEEIYKQIDQNEEVVLNNCYVRNFSLSVYRKSRDLPSNKRILLNKFSACNAIFDSEESTDFSYSYFTDFFKNFENALFLHGKVIFHNALFRKGGVNFRNAAFHDGFFDFSYAEMEGGELNFTNTFFAEGKKNFQNSKFGEGKVLFQNTSFGKGDVSFVDTQFDKGVISFKASTFQEGKVDFHFASFGTCDLSFEQADLGSGKVDFRKTEWNNSKINFNRAVFGTGDKLFEAAQIVDGKITFKKTDWGDGIKNFELIEFQGTTMLMDKSILGKGELSFNGATLESLSLKSCHLNYYVDLRVKSCAYIDLSDTIIRDILDIRPFPERIQINGINFSGLRLIGRIFMDWQSNHMKDLIKNQANTTTREKAEQFRILKENFFSTGHYSDEDKAYVEFKRQERKAKRKEAIGRNRWNSLWVYPSHAFQWLIFDKAGLYATSPLRVFVSMLISYVMFALLYYILPMTADTKIVSSLSNTDLSDLSIAFYHSAITFLTIGYGDYYPTGIIRWLCGIEGFTGLFLMSYFTVAFVRKILR